MHIGKGMDKLVERQIKRLTDRLKHRELYTEKGKEIDKS
jgi:hypothetical protein